MGRWVAGGAVGADNITDATTVGKAVIRAANAAAGRTAIGAGTSSFSGAYSALTGAPVVTVPAATGVSTTDTANIQAVLTALPTGGGVVIFPPGNYTVASGGLTCSKPVLIIGAPGMGGLGTTITMTAATGTLLTLSAANSVVENLTLTHTGTRSTGLVGLDIADATFAHLHRARVESFYINVKIDNGYYYTLTECSIRDFVSVGLDVSNAAAPDSGDGVVTGCQFDGGATVTGATAISWHSGGGLRVVNNKFLGGSTSPPIADVIKLVVPDGVVTSVLVIANNSFEHFTGKGITLTRGGTTGIFTNSVLVTGNEFAPYNDTATTGVYIDTWITGVAITGNHFFGLTTGVYVNQARHVAIEGNTWTNIKTTGIRVGTTAVDLVVGRQPIDMQTGGQALVYDDPTFAGDPSWETSIAFANLTTTTAVDLAQIYMPQFAILLIEIEVTGVNQGAGMILSRQVRAVSSGSTGADLTVATLGTDQNSGTVTITYPVTGLGGSVKVAVAKPAGGTNLSGHIRIRVRGNGLGSFKQLLRND